MEYGLIGARLGHSFSKPIHEALNPGASYELHPLPEEEQARAFLSDRQFSGINVTIPYKRLVMEYCDEIAPAAKAIGAVNTVTITMDFWRWQAAPELILKGGAC